ncbi:MAG: DUF3307 domain-containing protein [Elusimicrobiota bacterium]
MSVFWRLLLAHLLTDFTFQTDKIALWKRGSIGGVVFHSSIFLLISVLFCLPFLNQTWWKLPGYLCIFLLFLIHFIEDYYRILSIQKAGAPDNILFFVWDQFIHIVIIFLFTPTTINLNISGKKELFPLSLISGDALFSDKIFIVLSIAVVVTHFTSILIYYLEQHFYGRDLITNRLKGKYYLIVERLFIFVCLLLPGPWWLVFPVVWLIRPLAHRNNNAYKFSRMNIILSNILAIVSGFITRFILHT